MIAGIVPAGGAGRRMGGVDKSALLVGGIPLLDRVLGAARAVCDRLVVVGPERPTSVVGVEFVVEDRPGGGPATAVGAGLRLAGACDVVLVIAGDLPLITAADLRRLVSVLGEDAGVDAAAAGHGDQPNPLLAAYRGAALAASCSRLGAGAPAALLLPPATTVVDLGRASLNLNRPEDVEAAERALSEPGQAGPERG